MKKQSILFSLVIILAGFLAMPEIANAQRNSTNISSRNGIHNFSARRGSTRLEVEYKGRIEFSDDDKSIKSISRGGYLRMWIDNSGDDREVLAEDDGGTIEYEYYEGRKRGNFEADGTKWLADNLIKVIRATGLGAEARVERFYKNDGVDGVLEEISSLTGDYVSHIYLTELLHIDGIKENELVKIADYAPRKLESDYYISEVFKEHGDLFLKADKTIEAFLSAMRRMDSDYYIAAILSDVLREDLSDEAVDKVLDNLNNMDSDYYKASVIKDVFGSDLSKVQMISVLNAIGDINSDYYKSAALKRACRVVSRADDDVKSSFRKAARGINSDYYYGTVARCID